MDRNEYKEKLEQIREKLAEEDYAGAAELADEINWRKVKSVSTLCFIAEIYGRNRRLEESRELLLLAYAKSPVGKNIIYRLVLVSLKLARMDEAREFYEDFLEVAPHDNMKYVLRYEIARAQRAPLREQISILEELKEREYTEEWAFELAYLYHKNDEAEKCVAICDELVLWFGEGKYVQKALELKMLHEPLNRLQEEKYRAMKMGNGDVVVTPEDKLQSGEIVMQSMTIAPVQMDPGRFNTVNLQDELAKNMQQIMDATEQETVVDTINNMKRLFGMEPDYYKPQEKTRERLAYEHLLAEEADGQIRLQVPDVPEPVPQVTGQIKIDDILAEWERAKEAAREEMLLAEQKLLEETRERALRDAREMMDRYQAEQRAAEEAEREAQLQAETIGFALLEEERTREAEMAGTEEEEISLLESLMSKPFREMTLEEQILLHQELEKRIRKEQQKLQDLVDAKEASLEENLEEKTEEDFAEIEEVSEAEDFEEEELLAEDFEEESVENPEENIAEAEVSEEDFAETDEAPEENIAEEVIDEASEETAENSIEEALDAEEEFFDEEDLEETFAEDTAEAEESFEEGDFEEEDFEEEEADDAAEKEASSLAFLADVAVAVSAVDAAEKAVGATAVVAEEAILEETALERELTEEELIAEEIRKLLLEEEQAAVEKEQATVAEEEQQAEVDDTAFPEASAVAAEAEAREAQAAEAAEAAAEATAQEEQAAEAAVADAAAREQQQTENGISFTGFTRGQKEQFSYVMELPGMEKQITKAMAGVLEKKQGNKSSATGNLILAGKRESGKSTLATNFIRVYQRLAQRGGGKVGKIHAFSLNQKDLSRLFDAMSGGFLIIEHAGEMSKETTDRLALLMEQDTNGMMVILEDEAESILELSSRNPHFMKKFTQQITIPNLTLDELVLFAKTYAAEKKYKIDEMGILALYNRISNIQRLDETTRLSEVITIVDGAIASAKSGGLKRLFGGKRGAEGGFDLLREKDFEE